MEDSARSISATYLQDDQVDEAEAQADCCLDLGTFCEQVRVQMEKVQLSLVSADTEQEKRRQISRLQSIVGTITHFCAAYTETVDVAKTKEMDREEKVEAESVMSSHKFSTATKEMEQETSVTVRVQEDAATNREKPATDTLSKSDHSDDDECSYEEAAFARFRAGWERAHGDNKSIFEDLTLISPMLFTHCTPGFMPIDAVIPKTVQVCSIKVTDLKHFNWPLQVYGVVAARDAVDQRRNPIFLCPRDDCQILSKSYPFLHLTGPVRAIVSEEPVDIEIQLVVKGTTAAEDRALISYAFLYEGNNGGARVRTSTIEKYSCTLELCTQQVIRSVQATIFGLRIVDVNSMPEYGFKVLCSTRTQSINEPPEVVLFDSKVGRKCAMKNGFLNLSRQVVSVEMRGKLKLTVQAYSESGDVAAESHVLVDPKRCNTTHHELHFGGLKVDFTVAWSLLVDDEDAILINGMADPFSLLPPMHPSIASLLK